MDKKRKKYLKHGYTTGACAAAAAKGAAIMLLEQKEIESVSITLPIGEDVSFKLTGQQFEKTSACCGVKKFAGDDPDVTDGAVIIARVSDNPKFKIIGGHGVGFVTRPGLPVAPGNWAINPVPMKMIEKAVREVLPPEKNILVEISVPGGEKIAKKTFNPSLGIKGGISILGTTGIVKPMSEEAMKKSLSLKLSQLKAEGVDPVVFCPGNYGTNFAASQLGIPKASICTISNWPGYMLEQAVDLSVSRVLLIGHIGKLIKIAGRIFNTHSKAADGRQEILAAHYALVTEDLKGFKKIMASNTTEEAIGYINNPAFYNYLADKIAGACGNYVKGELEVACALFSLEQGLLGKSKQCDHFINEVL